MPFLLLDPFANPMLWAALDPGNLLSAEVSLAAGGPPHPHAVDPAALRVSLTGAATGHRIERALAAVDLTGFDRLAFWCRTDVAMRGAASDALRLRMRIGSAALPIGTVGNNWHRYLTAPTSGDWGYQSFDLSDLAPAVRDAVDRIEIGIIATTAAHVVWLDGLEARRSAPVADCDAALLARLDGVLQIAGAPVPAVFAPDEAVSPFFRIVHYQSLYGRARASHAARPADPTDDGQALRPAAVPWDLYYRIAFVAPTRAEQGAMLDFVMATLGAQGWLAVGNQAVRIDQIPAAEPDDSMLEGPILRYRASAWAEAAVPGEAVVPVEAFVVVTELAEVGT